VYIVKDGLAKFVPIEVQADDQRLAQVNLLERMPDGTARHRLNGTEEIINSNHSKLTDGQPITPIPEDWKP
jgi:hypothetical protein